MADLAIALRYRTDVYDLEIGSDSDFELLSSLVFSLSGVPAEEQVLVLDGFGRVTSVAQLPPGSTLALIRCELVTRQRPRQGSSLPTRGRALASESCSRVYSPFDAIAQPLFRVASGHVLCAGCAGTCVVPGSAQPALGRATAVCQCLERPGSSCLFESRIGVDDEDRETQRAALEALRELQRELEMRAGLETAVAGACRASPAAAAGIQGMAQRLVGMASHVRLYEEPATLAGALKAIPVAALHERAASNPSAMASFADELLLQLLRWFKTDFFQWVTSPPCSHCGSTDVAGRGGAAPSTPEERAGLAGVVELYSCRACGVTSRFPRYNHPLKLLTWRKGRCGEWANAFTLCCLTLGFDARHVTDWSDHVFTEVWSPALARWLHLDPCETAFDSPLMYEGGWGKKLSYIVAVGLEEVVDVSRRYTKQWDAVLARRTALPEAALSAVLAALDAAQLMASPYDPAAHAQYLRRRREVESRQLAALVAFDDGVRRGEEQLGRISGSLAWRQSRGEVGSAAAATSPAGAPVVEPRLLSARAALPPLAAPAANVGVASAGWELLSAATPPLSAPLPAAGSLLFAAWGAQLLLGTPAGQLFWRPLVPQAATAAAATQPPQPWKGIAVLQRGGESGTAPVVPLAWPPEGHTLVSIATDAQRDRFFVATVPAAAGAVAEAAAPRALRGSGAGGRPVESGAPAASGIVWMVRPERLADVSGTLRPRWVATAICAVPVPDAQSCGPCRLPLTIAGGKLCAVVSGALCHCETPVAELVAAVAVAAVPAPAPPLQRWHSVCDAPGISALASTEAGLLLGYRGAVEARPASGDSRSVEGIDSAVVVLVRLAAAADASVGLSMTPPATCTSETASKVVALSGPVVLPLVGRSVNDPAPVGLLRPSHVAAAELCVSGGDVGAARTRRDWFAYVSIGLLSESAVLRAVELSYIDEPIGPFLDTTPPSDEACVRVPSRALPSIPGLYELRHFCGAGWDGGLVATSRSFSVAGCVPDAAGWTWVPLCPAANLAGLSVAVISASAAGGRSSTSAVLATTTSGELWGLDLPASLLTAAEDQRRSAVPSAVCVVAGTAWELDSSAASGSTHGAASEAAQIPTAPVEIGATSVSAPASDAGAAAPPPVSSAVPPAAAAAAGVSDVRARFAVLFKQLTSGHDRADGAASDSANRCAHPYCASNPANEPLVGTAAATRALQLVASGAPDEELLCHHGAAGARS